MWGFDLDAGFWPQLTPAGAGSTMGVTNNAFPTALFRSAPRRHAHAGRVGGSLGRPAPCCRWSASAAAARRRVPGLASLPTGVMLAVNQYGTWTDEWRFLSNYIPGASPSSLDGVNVAAVPGLTASPPTSVRPPSLGRRGPLFCVRHGDGSRARVGGARPGARRGGRQRGAAAAPARGLPRRR